MTPDQREEMRVIFRSVASEWGFDEADLYVRDKTGALSKARADAWARCRRAGYSFKVIAALAGWDHSSLICAIKKAPRPVMFTSRRIHVAAE